MTPRSDADAMPTSNVWIVCENSGHWAAALRVALDRQTANASVTPRIFEVRSLAELDSAMNVHVAALGIVEVRSDNLADVLDLLTKGRRRNARFAALLDASLGSPASVARRRFADRQFVVDALWEAGAVAVIDSPRQICVVLKFAELHAASCTKLAARTHELESIAEHAWDALPWQEG
jgi:hypothetical protein